MQAIRDERIALFSTCPPSNVADNASAYLRHVVDAAKWSEHAGCKGTLVYSDNSMVDPWLVALTIAQQTQSLCPLVAVQPIYMHPYTVAKMVSSIAYLSGRRVYLNMVAGGFKNDLVALNDATAHDKRYDRLVEYTLVIKRLLDGETVTFDGEFYKVDKLKLAPPLARELLPGIFISGSSDAGLAAAKAIGATAIKYPKALGDSAPEPGADIDSGVRVGIISRASDAEAWSVADMRFPHDRAGQLTHQLAMKVSDSVWHKQLSESTGAARRDTYWLGPFENYKTMCPYLVGDHAAVGRHLAGYIERGHRTFILDVPPNPEEFSHTCDAFNQALEMSTCRTHSMNG
jgi:alkanesulfonate monooxygenase